VDHLEHRPRVIGELRALLPIATLFLGEDPAKAMIEAGWSTLPDDFVCELPVEAMQAT
jgi:hypothetical protein